MLDNLLSLVPSQFILSKCYIIILYSIKCNKLVFFFFYNNRIEVEPIISSIYLNSHHLNLYYQNVTLLLDFIVSSANKFVFNFIKFSFSLIEICWPRFTLINYNYNFLKICLGCNLITYFLKK